MNRDERNMSWIAIGGVTLIIILAITFGCEPPK